MRSTVGMAVPGFRPEPQQERVKRAWQRCPVQIATAHGAIRLCFAKSADAWTPQWGCRAAAKLVIYGSNRGPRSPRTESDNVCPRSNDPGTAFDTEVPARVATENLIRGDEPVGL